MVHYRASAVILADGGFQANRDLLRRHISLYPDQLLQRNAGTGMGDGLLMAQAIGAGVTDLRCFYGHVQSRDAMRNPELWPYPTLDFPVAAGMAVDEHGHRFTDEGLAGVAVANAIARLDNPLGAVAIFDQAIWEASAKTYVMSANPFLIETGATMFRGDTLDGLAERAGLPASALQQSVSDYNLAVETGDFTKLEPRRSVDHPHPWGSHPMPIHQPPFFAVPLCAGITYTMGGLAIDAKARVLRTDGAPDPRSVCRRWNHRWIGGRSLCGLYGWPRQGARVRSHRGRERRRFGRNEMISNNNGDFGQVGPPTHSYPAIRFLVRHGQLLALAIGAAIGMRWCDRGHKRMGVGVGASGDFRRWGGISTFPQLFRNCASHCRNSSTAMIDRRLRTRGHDASALVQAAGAALP